MLMSPIVQFERFIPFWTFLFSSFFSFKITRKYNKTYVGKVHPTNCWVGPGTQLKRSTIKLLRRPKKRENNRKQMFEIFIFLKKNFSNFILGSSIFFEVPYFSHFTSVVDAKYTLVTVRLCTIQKKSLNDPTRQMFELCRKIKMSAEKR